MREREAASSLYLSRLYSARPNLIQQNDERTNDERPIFRYRRPPVASISNFPSPTIATASKWRERECPAIDETAGESQSIIKDDRRAAHIMLLLLLLLLLLFR